MRPLDATFDWHPCSKMHLPMLSCLNINDVAFLTSNQKLKEKH